MSDSENMTSPSRYCTNCGTPLEENAKFCTNCGSPVPIHDFDTGDLGLPKEMLDASKEDAPTEVLPGAAEAFEGGASVQDASTRCIPAVPDASTQRIPTAADRPPVKISDTAPMPVVPGPTPQEAVQPTDRQPVSYSVHNDQNKPRDTKKIIIIVACVVVALAIIGGVAFALLGNKGSSDSGAVVVDNTTQSSDKIVVELTDTYRTQFAQKNSVTYPAFEFSYPASWSVAHESTSIGGEWVDLTSSDGASVSFGMWPSDTQGSAKVDFVNVEKVADAAFKPGMVQGTDYSRLGSFIVAKGTMQVNGDDSGVLYALLPSSVLSNMRNVSMGTGVPGFDYGSIITFESYPEGEISAQTEQEIIAILASFTVSDAQVSTTVKTSDYVLPESDTRYYSEDELQALSDYDLYVARNEIFARYGRMFNNEDLNTYFNSKTWYSPTIAPEDFSDSMLNKYEKANVEAMAKIENDRNSPYIK